MPADQINARTLEVLDRKQSDLDEVRVMKVLDENMERAAEILRLDLSNHQKVAIKVSMYKLRKAAFRNGKVVCVAPAGCGKTRIEVYLLLMYGVSVSDDTNFVVLHHHPAIYNQDKLAWERVVATSRQPEFNFEVQFATTWQEADAKSNEKTI